jgi:hypothetical protein
MQENPRPLPPTPHQTAQKPSMGIQILKDTSQFMIQEFEDACTANITNIKSSVIDPVKPEGYGTQVQYYTQSDKIGLIGNLNSLLKKTVGTVKAKLNGLEAEETAQKGALSNQEILKSFREIYGILNEGRKNCAFSLSQIEKQTARTKTLKECQLAPKKDPSPPQKKKSSISHNVKKLLPGSHTQKKDQQAVARDMSDREPPTTSPKAKKVLGTKETREEQRQRPLQEALKRSGLS